MTNLFQTAVIGAAVLAAFTSSVRGDCPCCTADGAQYYADALHGSDANDGLTVATAKSTIQAAVDLATAGDAVNILPGEYLAGFTLEPRAEGEPTANCITLRGLGEVVIRVGPSPNYVHLVSGARIEGISFRSAGTSPSQLRMAHASNVLVNRCRFTGGEVGLLTEMSSTNVTIRESLFRGATVYAMKFKYSNGNAVERCTLARNQQALNAQVAYTHVRSTALYRNVGHSVSPSFFYSYSNFFGEEQCDPDPTNICGVDPLFIDVDYPAGDPADDVYYVKAGSPLLSGGESGGPIGAFGQGFHTSKNLSVDEPVQAATPWGNWIDSNGDCFRKNEPVVCPSVLVELNDDDEVILQGVLTSAAIYSPVFNTESQFTVIRSVDFAAFVENMVPGGSGEISIRTSMSSFDQDPSTGPTFEAVDKHVKFRKRAQYVQMELVLRIDGD